MVRSVANGEPATGQNGLGPLKNHIGDDGLEVALNLLEVEPWCGHQANVNGIPEQSVEGLKGNWPAASRPQPKRGHRAQDVRHRSVAGCDQTERLADEANALCIVKQARFPRPGIAIDEAKGSAPRPAASFERCSHWADRLKAALESHNLKVWIDRDQMRPGNILVEDTDAALSDCRSFLLIVSPSAIRSEWVREEYFRAVALAKNKERPLRLIPVILGKAEVPGFLATRNWVEFLDESTFEANLQRLIWGITGKKRTVHHGPPVSASPQRATEPPVNPYIFERPAVGEHFYGRMPEMARLVNALREGRSVVVYGLQRVGKTSLVKEALDRELKPNGVPFRDIRIDMYESAENLTSYIDFFETIVDRLCDHLAPADYKKIRDQARIMLRTGSDEKTIRSRIKSLLVGYQRRFGTPLLYIDEFQDISKSFQRAQSLRTVTHPLDSGFIKYIGSLIKEGVLQLLCCGRYQIQSMDSRLDWQLLKLMVPIELSVLDEDSARRLIVEPVAGRFHYEETAIRKLLVLSGCYPYLVQYLCYELVEKARRCGHTRIDEVAVAELVDMIHEPQLRLLYDDFQDLDDRVPWRLLISLAHLAGSERQRVEWESIAGLCRTELGMKAQFSECGDALALLKNSQIVGEEQTGSTLSYYIRPDVLRVWLRTRNYFFKERITRSDRLPQSEAAAATALSWQAGPNNKESPG